MSRNTSTPFELQVQPEDEERYELVLWQQVVHQNGTTQAQRRQVARLRGTPLMVAMDHVLDTLKSEGYRATALRPSDTETLRISDEAGVRLGLLFLALKPLSKVDRMEAIGGGLRNMPTEEVYYWFSKCASADGNRNAQRALRVLLGGE